MSRKRSRNFSPDERQLLLDLVTAKKEVLLYTRSDCLFSTKAEAWNEAVNEFNVGATQTRIKKALTTLFDGIKAAVKQCYRE